MAKKSAEPGSDPVKPDIPVPESEVVSLGDIQLSDDPDAATAQIAEAQADQGQPNDPSEPSKITIGGQEFEVDPGLASALQAQTDDFQRQHEELRGLMPKRPAADSEPVIEPVKGPDFGNMIFDDPARFVQEFGDKIRRETVDEMKGQYSADQGMRDFWTTFYRENDDLREFDWIVQASLNRHSSDLMDLPVSQAVSKLAEMSRADILGVANQFAPSKSGKTSRTTVESGRPSEKAAASKGEEGEKPSSAEVTSISSALRARKQRRREASG